MSSGFIAFCRERGIMIDALPPFGVWKSYPTEDKPNKRNGRVKYLGDHGHAQNYRLMDRVETWKLDRDSTPIDAATIAKWKAQAEAAAARQRVDRAEAARKAANILHACRVGRHPYLEAKGFPEAEGNVYAHRSGAQLLVVPMRRDNRLVGLQFIDETGAKKFMEHQESRGAELVIDNKGEDWLVEGYATALSLQLALQAIKCRYRIHVCFSAFNLGVIGEQLRAAGLRVFVAADNDPQGAGEAAAKRCATAYWMSDTIGEDFNDAHRRLGVFKVSQAIKRVMMSAPPR